MRLKKRRAHLELCGGQCIRGINCTNRGSYNVAIYVRSGNAWRKALSTEATGRVFLSTTDYTVNTDGTVISDGGEEFKALVLNVFLGSEECPIEVRKVHWSKVVNWKLPCTAVVGWNGTKFVYKPLTAVAASAAEMPKELRHYWCANKPGWTSWSDPSKRHL